MNGVNLGKDVGLISLGRTLFHGVSQEPWKELQAGLEDLLIRAKESIGEDGQQHIQSGRGLPVKEEKVNRVSCRYERTFGEHDIHLRNLT